jgi:hypothetical protein
MITAEVQNLRPCGKRGSMPCRHDRGRRAGWVSGRAHRCLRIVWRRCEGRVEACGDGAGSGVSSRFRGTWLPVNQQDQQAIDDLFQHLDQSAAQAGPPDPKAAARIQQHVQQGPPGLAYHMAQTLVGQQAALRQLRAQLADSQQQLRQSGPPNADGEGRVLPSPSWYHPAPRSHFMRAIESFRPRPLKASATRPATGGLVRCSDHEVTCGSVLRRPSRPAVVFPLKPWPARLAQSASVIASGSAGR